MGTALVIKCIINSCQEDDTINCVSPLYITGNTELFILYCVRVVQVTKNLNETALPCFSNNFGIKSLLSNFITKVWKFEAGLELIVHMLLCVP